MLEVVRKRTRNFENGVLADDPALVDPLDYELLEFRVREAAGENGFLTACPYFRTEVAGLWYTLNRSSGEGISRRGSCWMPTGHRQGGGRWQMRKGEFKDCDVYAARIAALRPFPKETLKSLREYYRVGLTYTSNALEGNSLTESETKVIIEDGLTIGGKPLRDVYEATGHAKAYDFLYWLTKVGAVSEEDILEIHRLFYGQIDGGNAGVWRKVRVFISGSRRILPAPDKVPELMAAFVKWMAQNEGRMHPVEFAALVHQKFVYVHPFVDGNGRVARLLMNLALMRAGWTLAVIPPICRHEYIATLEKAGRQPAPFVRFVRDRVCETQKELLRLMGRPIALDDEGIKPK